MSVKREDYRYDESGLSNVVLEGITVRRCPGCDAAEPTIPNIEGLHRAIAQALITQPRRLSGEEIRFLRTYLGWTGVDFARHMGVVPTSVSRWENDKEPIGPQAERALRLMVATRDPERSYPLDRLAELSDQTDTAEMRMRARGAGWRLAA
jgi:putative zinc finger/helix-turn-helix YgiT family protein